MPLAMLTGKPLPSSVRFYKKRALRILPAYWVALAVLLAFNWRIAKDPVWLNGLTHSLFIHDIFPRYNRDLNGPFWTLAVEAQFYLALPWIATAVAWVVGHTRRGGSTGRPQTARRVIAGLLGMIAVALVIRWVGIQVMGALPASAPNAGGAATALWWLGLLLIGMQGKYLEVFLVGAIAATLYTATAKLRGVQRERLRPIALGLALFGLAVMVPCAISWQTGTVLYQAGAQWGWDVLLYPLATGIGYSAILLGVVWGGRWLRAPFEFPALRFIGFISYSVYIWHLPILHADITFLQPVPLAARLVLVFVVAYLSYQFVERPFLQRQRRGRPRPPSPTVDAATARRLHCAHRRADVSGGRHARGTGGRVAATGAERAGGCFVCRLDTRPCAVPWLEGALVRATERLAGHNGPAVRLRLDDGAEAVIALGDHTRPTARALVEAGERAAGLRVRIYHLQRRRAPSGTAATSLARSAR